MSNLITIKNITNLLGTHSRVSISGDDEGNKYVLEVGESIVISYDTIEDDDLFISNLSTLVQRSYIEVRMYNTVLAVEDLSNLRSYAASSESTIADLDIYVNGSTGSDTTGDGSARTPYATLTYAYSKVPRIINHAIHIHVAAGTYSAFPTNINHTFGESGILSFDGTAALSDVSVSKTIDAGGVTTLELFSAMEFPVVGGGLSVNAYRGKYIKFTSGSISGAIVAVLSNTATTIRTQCGYFKPAAGDTFKVVEPGVTLNISNSRTVMSGGTLESPVNYGLLGLNVTTTGKFVFSNTGVALTASIVSGNVRGNTVVFDPVLGGHTLSKVIDDTGLLNQFNGVGILKKGAGSAYAIFQGTVSITRGVFFDYGCDFATANGNVSASCVCNAANGYGFDLYAYDGAIKIQNCYIEAKSNNYGVRSVDVGRTYLQDVYIESASAALRAWPGISNVLVTGLIGNNSNVANALLIGQGCSATIQASTCTLVGSGGAGNAVKWSSGAANSSYPAANNRITDSKGAQVAGY